jgi:Gram-negative bacterial TonB protein C-terminal
MFKNHATFVWLFFILGVGALAQEPTLKWLKRIDPVYPQMAKIANIQGEVLIELELDPQGTIVGLLPVSGHPILIQAATESLRESKFACENCGEENRIFSVVIRFKMVDPPKPVSQPCVTLNEAPPTAGRAQISTRKRRSARCLYLWRCATG